MSSGSVYLANPNDITDYNENVSLGLISKRSALIFTGENANVNSNSVQTVWDLETEYVFSTSQSIDTISSASALDVGIPILITGTDFDYNEVTQIAFLNGQNKVTLSNTLFRVNNMLNISPTSGTTGPVYLYEDTAIVSGVPSDLSFVRGHIASDRESSQMAVQTIPVGKSFLLKQFIYLMNKEGGGIETRLSIDFVAHRPDGSGGQISQENPEVSLFSRGMQIFDQVFIYPLNVPEKIDLEFKVLDATNDNMGLVVTIVGVLIEN